AAPACAAGPRAASGGARRARTGDRSSLLLSAARRRDAERPKKQPEPAATHPACASRDHRAENTRKIPHSTSLWTFGALGRALAESAPRPRGSSAPRRATLPPRHGEKKPP